MRYEITKLDYLHNHCTRYQFMICFSSSFFFNTDALDFDRARRWFNQTYGLAQKAEIQIVINQQCKMLNDPPEANPHWAYQTKYRDYRIYVASDKELAWFQLAHVRET